jgi:hypothetical protein
VRADTPENHPATTDLASPVLTAEGNLLASFRDESSAQTYVRMGPETDWTPLGAPVTGVTWVSARENAHAWVLASGMAYDCYCTFPNVSWSPLPDDAGEVLAAAQQILPRARGTPAVVSAEASLLFHPSETCVVVQEPSEDALDSFVFDLLTAERTSLPRLSFLQWVDAEGGGPW